MSGYDTTSEASPARSAAPLYRATGDEVELFQAARAMLLPVLLKGPTGCGKTRLVEHVAHLAGVPLYTVSCHEDLTASDLLGRYVLAGGDTEWVDGPLTRAVREGGICYMDEVVEARQDATVAIHSLTDHRRTLHIERRGGEALVAADGFQLVVSYNPGYQSVLKDLKMSTRQRMVAIDLDFPDAAAEQAIVEQESHVDAASAAALVRLARALRRAEDSGLTEGASTRTLIAAGAMMRAGMSFRQAVTAAVVGPLTDDRRLRQSLITLADSYAP